MNWLVFGALTLAVIGVLAIVALAAEALARWLLPEERSSAIVAILRPRDGRVECLDTDIICTRHGATSTPRPTDSTLTREEAIDLAEGDGLVCSDCGFVIVDEIVCSDCGASGQHHCPAWCDDPCCRIYLGDAS